MASKSDKVEAKYHKVEPAEFEIKSEEINTYDSVVSSFIQYLSANPAEPRELLALFGTTPIVGITTTAPIVGITSDGPIYVGTAQVTDLLNAIAKTFPKFCFEETWRYQATRAYDPKNQPKTVNIQSVVVTGTLKGSHTGIPWNPGFDSSPLNGAPVTGRAFRSLAACCIFSFPNPSNPPLPADLKISSLAIYFDRYQMLNQLGLAK